MCGIFISVHSFRLWIFFSYPSNGSLVPSLTTFVCWKESHFLLFFFPSPPSYFSLWSCLKVSSVNTKGVWVKKNCQHSKRTQLVTIVDIDAWLIVGVASIIAFYLEQKWYIVCVCIVILLIVQLLWCNLIFIVTIYVFFINLIGKWLLSIS